MAYLPAGISIEELLTAAEDLQTMLPTPMASRPSKQAAAVAGVLWGCSVTGRLRCLLLWCEDQGQASS